VIERYRAEKDRRGLLDYDDLIEKTLALFTKTSAAWVLYKLDLGIDHMLVDEAQDTSPQQWDIIKTIVAEFVPGGSRQFTRRTVFAVADEKQSIFSFQGAAPAQFAAMREHFRRLYENTDVTFAIEKLEFSFRSAPQVLQAVDAVFKRPEAFHGLTADPVWTVHLALPDATPGEVEIWDLIAPDDRDAGKEGWDAPFDTARETSPSIKLAAKIARTVKSWIAAGIRPKDMLILVRNRGAVFEAVIRALKREGIEVAGADRLVLTEHIAIMDLLVLGDALLLPDDDLALATVLKSPLFGLGEDQLYALAHDRKRPLRVVLRAKANDDPAFAAAAKALDELAEQARHRTPFAFYAHVLGARNSRAHFLARLGVEASDPLDEFLNRALAYERRETPSLQGFLNWIRAAQSEVKRDMEMARDEVRVMTVHGAKGLEARNVILIDTTTVRPEGPYPPRLLTVPLGNAAPGAAGLIWGAAKDKDAGPMAQARTVALEAARDEYRRLLYVGLTRAAERLVVCGVKGVNKIPDNCWHQLVSDALKPLSVEEDDGDGKVWRFHKAEGAAAAADKSPPPEKIELPLWLKQPPEAEPPGSRLLRPSRTQDDDDPAHRFAGSSDRDKALARGTLLHRLIQSLPDIPPAQRAEAAVHYLARAGKDFNAAERNTLAGEVLRLLDDSRFAALFAPGSRAEVSIAGKLAGRRDTFLVAGQIDRLAVTDNEVLIADYKTNRPAPKRIADVPPAYTRQLALYRAMLRKLYPDHAVRAVLVWTETPDSMEVSSDVLDATLAHHLGVTAA
jgi:ATP-dependent helicase/nuclease subunit A